jgi:hypothetical protein
VYTQSHMYHPGPHFFFNSGLSHTDATIQIGTLEPVPGTRRVRCQLSSGPITSEPVPIPPFYKLLQIVLVVVVSTVHVCNMRYFLKICSRSQPACGRWTAISFKVLLIFCMSSLSILESRASSSRTGATYAIRVFGSQRDVCERQGSGTSRSSCVPGQRQISSASKLRCLVWTVTSVLYDTHDTRNMGYMY